MVSGSAVAFSCTAISALKRFKNAEKSASGQRAAGAGAVAATVVAGVAAGGEPAAAGGACAEQAASAKLNTRAVRVVR
jgi:hypothetical protein